MLKATLPAGFPANTISTHNMRPGQVGAVWRPDEPAVHGRVVYKAHRQNDGTVEDWGGDDQFSGCFVGDYPVVLLPVGHTVTLTIVK